MDGDYDYDRYDRDSDYADGVDDAMDEFDGDWQEKRSGSKSGLDGFYCRLQLYIS